VADTLETSGVPDDAAALRAENARLRDTAERQRMLLEDKDADRGAEGVGRAAGAAGLPQQRELLDAAEH